MVVTASANRLPSEPYPVVFADGTSVSLRVVAVVTDDSIPGDLLVPRAVVRTHDPSALTSTVYVRDRIDPPVGARIVDVATWAAEADAAEDRLVWLFTLLLIGVSAGYGAIAVANTLLLAAAGRAADLRLIRLAGATRRQVIWLVTAESALVVLIGALLGGAVAFVGLLSIRAGLAEQVGAPVDLVVPWPVVGGVVGLCLLLAVVASVLPTWRLLRHRPARSPVGASSDDRAPTGPPRRCGPVPSTDAIRAPGRAAPLRRRRAALGDRHDRCATAYRADRPVVGASAGQQRLLGARPAVHRRSWRSSSGWCWPAGAAAVEPARRCCSAASGSPPTWRSTGPTRPVPGATVLLAVGGCAVLGALAAVLLVAGARRTPAPVRTGGC